MLQKHKFQVQLTIERKLYALCKIYLVFASIVDNYTDYLQTVLERNHFYTSHMGSI